MHMATDTRTKQRPQRGDGAVTPPIDLPHLRRYTMGDAALEAEILDLFFAQLPETLASLSGAETAADARRAAHTLKGSARAVGAWSVAKFAEQAEAMIVSGGAVFDPSTPAFVSVMREIDEEVALAQAFARAIETASKA